MASNKKNVIIIIISTFSDISAEILEQIYLKGLK